MSYKNFASFDKNNNQHMYVLSLARQLGWIENHPKWGKVADLEVLGKFIAKNTSSKKPLLKQSIKELQLTIHALEKVLGT